MDAEYDAILSHDFTGIDHEHIHQDLHGETTDNVNAGPSRSPEPEAELHADRRRVSSRHLGHLTEEERKARQKAQNRKAAERSRLKKRDELANMENLVNDMQEENVRLKARLSELLASRNATAPPDIASSLAPPTPQAPGGTGIDYTYIQKLQTELSTSKIALLERELELAQLKKIELPLELDTLRHNLLRGHITVTGLQAEAASLESMVNHLKTEKDELARQTEAINREVESRRGEPREKEALMDIGGWVDEAVRNWHESEPANEGNEQIV